MWFSSRQKINLKSQNKPRAQDAKHKNKHEWSHEQLKRLGMTQVFGLPFFGSGAVADDGASSPLLSSSLHSSLVLFLINPSFPFFGFLGVTGSDDSWCDSSFGSSIASSSSSSSSSLSELLEPSLSELESEEEVCSLFDGAFPGRELLGVHGNS